MEIVHISPLTFCIHLDQSWDPNRYDPRSDIEEWAEENIKNTWFMRSIYVSFRSKNDAMAFKLRWT